MLSFLRSYFLIAVVSVSLLLGIQIPNFVDQYQKRVNAHQIEVSKNLAVFQIIADQFYKGSIESLIHKHENSLDSTFQMEANAIRSIYERKKHFDLEALALQNSLWGRVWHVFLEGDTEVFEETMNNYSASILLNKDAMVFALTFALGIVLFFDLLLYLLAYFGRSLIRT